MESIITTEHNGEHPYAQISKSLLQDKNLDFATVGFLSRILGKPKDFKIIVPLCALEYGASKPVIHRLLKKAIEAGYCYRSLDRYRDERGRWRTSVHYMIFESQEKRQEFLDLGRLMHERPKTA